MFNRLRKLLFTKRNLPLLVSRVLFFASLTQVCYCTSQSCVDSLLALFIGMLGVVFGYGFSSIAIFTWLANPLLLFSWIKYNSNIRQSLILAILAATVSLSFLSCHKITANEGGGLTVITDYKLGYWLWLASSVTMVAGNLLLWYDRRQVSKATFKR